MKNGGDMTARSTHYHHIKYIDLCALRTTLCTLYTYISMEKISFE